MSDKKGFSQLSLQVGSVTAAVEDLMAGYEIIVDSLPTVAEKVSQMHSSTSNLAQDLENRMSNLIDGYGYLQSVAIDMPQSIRDLAQKNRQSLLNAIGTTIPSLDPEFLDSQTRQLDVLRSELNEISEKRIIQQVETKNVVSNKPRGTLTLMRNRQEVKPGSSQQKPVNEIRDPFDPIPIPSYKPPNPSKLENITNNAIHTSNLTVRSVGNKVIVPNVRIGSLPSELENLVTTPVDIPVSDKRPGRRNHHFKRVVNTKFIKTDKEVAHLRETLLQTSKKLSEDQANARKELRDLLASLQTEVKQHDNTVSSVLSKVIKETMTRVENNTITNSPSDIKVANPTAVQRKLSRSHNKHTINSRTGPPDTDSESRSSSETHGYKIITVRSKHGETSPQHIKTNSPTSNKPLIVNSETVVNLPKTENTQIVHAPTTPSKSLQNEASTQSICDSAATNSPEIVLNDVNDQNKMPSSWVGMLVGTKKDGIHWEALPENENFKYASAGLPSEPHEPLPSPVLGTYLSANIGAYGGGRLFCMEVPDVDNKEQSIFKEAESIQILEEDEYHIKPQSPDILHTPALATNFVDNHDNLSLLIPAPQPSHKPSVWLSSVYPLTAPKALSPPEEKKEVVDIETTQEQGIAQSNLDGELLTVIHTMINAQRESAVQANDAQAALLSFFKDKLMKNEDPIPQAPVVDHVALAASVADIFKDMMTGILASVTSASHQTVQQPIIQPPQIIIQQPQTIVLPQPQIPAPTNIKHSHDESCQVNPEELLIDNLAFHNNNNPSVNAIDISKIEEVVNRGIQSGIVGGIRDILDIIIPPVGIDSDEIDTHLSAPERGWNAQAKQTIRGHIQSLDNLVNRTSPKIAHSNNEGQQASFLKLGRERAVEGLVEADILESQRRLNHLSTRLDDSEDDTSDQPSLKLFRDTAIESLSHKPFRPQLSSALPTFKSDQISRDDSELIMSESTSSSSDLKRSDTTRRLYRHRRKHPQQEQVHLNKSANPSNGQREDDDEEDEVFKSLPKQESMLDNQKSIYSTRQSKQVSSRSPCAVLVSDVLGHERIVLDDESLYGSEDRVSAEYDELNLLLSPTYLQHGLDSSLDLPSHRRKPSYAARTRLKKIVNDSISDSSSHLHESSVWESQESESSSRVFPSPKLNSDSGLSLKSSTDTSSDSIDFTNRLDNKMRPRVRLLKASTLSKL